ncbi:hypothetical protein D6764_01670 [Candidatus Woesearchaeota archaeon]|nr:MAG: hypothetical protein D6764_01670 [Candidatus Woesearchaeota archaeon]
MSILSIAQAFIGTLFALFVPGYLVTELVFKEMDLKEKIATGIAMSIGIDILLGIFLGYSKSQKELTGGITAYNAWFYMLVITAVLGTAVLLKKLSSRVGHKRK